MTSRHLISKLRCRACWRQPTVMASPALTSEPITSPSPLSPPISSRLQDPFPSSIIFSVRQFSVRRKRKGKVNPFLVLKVKRQTPYAQVKKIFLRVAMQHHPDTSSAKSDEEQEESREIFIKARQAFEALVENPEGGGVCLREELDDYVADDEHAHMDEWFKEETGYNMPFMDEATMKEVAAMTETMGGGGNVAGGDRDGGMWELARMVTRTVQSGGDGKNLLRLEAGEVQANEINDENLRARRRRNW